MKKNILIRNHCKYANEILKLFSLKAGTRQNTILFNITSRKFNMANRT